MIDESQLPDNPFFNNKYSDKLNNLKTLLSSAASQDSSAYTHSEALLQDIQGQTNSALANINDQISGGLNSATNLFSDARSIAIDTTVGKISGEGPTGGLIAQLISLIMDIIMMPIRFAFMSKGIGEGVAALVLSIEGLGQSTALAAEDLWLLLVSVGTILIKYCLCVISFVITTIGGCFLIHIITFVLSVMFLIFPLTAYVVERAIGYDLNPIFDILFEKMHEFDDNQAARTGVNLLRWPMPINLICYTCFGMPVALKDVLADVWALKIVGDMIAYDFSIRMPTYMKTATPVAQAAAASFDTAMGPLP
jgi:hypothetical protein